MKLCEMRIQGRERPISILLFEGVGSEKRIDSYDDIKDADYYDTTAAIASIYNANGYEYRKGSPRDLEDLELLYSIVDECTVMKGEITRSMRMEETIIQEVVKENTNRGLKFTTVMSNGKITEERYVTDTVSISCYKSDGGPITSIRPISMLGYSTNRLSSKLAVVKSEAPYYTMHELKQMYDLDHIDDYDYMVIESMDEAERRLKEFSMSDYPYKSVDIETTGLDMWVYGKDEVTGVILGENKEKATYFPFRQKKLDYNLPLDYMHKILDTLDALPKEQKVLAYNATMEINGLRKETGREVRIDGDGYLLSVLLSPKIVRGKHTLKNNANKYIGKHFLELSEIFKTKEISFDVLPKDIIYYYALPDGTNTIITYEAMLAQMDKRQLVSLELENKLVYCKAEETYWGLRTEESSIRADLDYITSKYQLLEKTFRELHKENGNIRSHKVLQNIIYGQLGAPVEILTEKGAPATSHAVIEYLIKKGRIKPREDMEPIKDIVDIKGKTIIKGIDLMSNRYPSLVILNEISTIGKQITELKRLLRNCVSNTIKFGINQVGTETNRQSSNAHQFSDTMKKTIKADSDQHYLWSVDYSSIELKYLAFISKDQEFIDAQNDSDLDVHRFILSGITGKPMYMITPKERKEGKSVNFGVVYGMTEYGLSNSLYGIDHTKEQLHEAAEKITDFFISRPHAKAFLENEWVKAQENHYSETIVGFRRHFLDFDEEGTITRRRLGSIKRASGNTPIQGGAAAILKMAEVNIRNYSEKKGWRKKVDINGVDYLFVRNMLSIHDELLISTHKSIPIEEVLTMFKKCFEINIKGAPKLFAPPALVPNWYDGKHNDNLELDIKFRDEIVEAYKEGRKGLITYETFEEDVTKYKKNKLINYMNGLISKFKTAEEVSKNVTHHKLTHTLIESQQKKIENAYDLTQEELILAATKMYMSSGIDMGVESVSVSEEVELTEKDFNEFNPEEVYIPVDDKGELLIDEEQEEELRQRELLDGQLNDYLDYNYVRTEFMIYSNTEAIIDISDLDEESIEKVVSEVCSYHKEGNYYPVIFMRGSDVMPTEIRVGNIRKNIDSLISSLHAL